MSRILTPTDTITITIDNRGPAPQATMKCSREMPAAQIIDVLLQLAVQLNREQAAKLGLVGPQPKPDTAPPAGSAQS